MKTKRITTCFFAIILLTVLVINICGAVLAQPQQFTVSLTTDKATYVLGEPVILTAVISYNGNVPLDVNNPLDNGDYKEQIEIASGPSNDFKTFITLEEARDALIDRASAFPHLHWEVGGKTEKNTTLFCWWLNKTETNQLIFSKPDNYQIRYSVSLGGTHFSSTTNVDFIEPENDVNQKAWQWLQKQDKSVLQEYGELDRLLAISEVKTRVLSHLNELLTQYPESAPAKYVSRVLASSKNEPAAIKSDPFEQAVKELESEWYDVKGYWRDMKLPGAQEYAQKRDDLYELQLTGKITVEDRARREAELLNTYVRKYCQPLPPAEWKRLNDAYAKEEADRMEQQIQEMKSHAAENERLLRASKTNTITN